MRLPVWWVVLVPLIFTACGQKGPLVLPKPTATPTSTAAEPPKP